MASSEEDKNGLPQTDESLVCTSETELQVTAESGSMNDLYRWRLNMAEGRVRKIAGLKAFLTAAQRRYPSFINWLSIV